MKVKEYIEFIKTLTITSFCCAIGSDFESDIKYFSIDVFSEDNLISNYGWTISNIDALDDYEVVKSNINIETGTITLYIK